MTGHPSRLEFYLVSLALMFLDGIDVPDRWLGSVVEALDSIMESVLQYVS